MKEKAADGTKEMAIPFAAPPPASSFHVHHGLTLPAPIPGKTWPPPETGPAQGLLALLPGPTWTPPVSNFILSILLPSSVHTRPAPKASLPLVLPQHKAAKVGPAPRGGLNKSLLSEQDQRIIFCGSFVLEPGYSSVTDRVGASGILMTDRSHYSQNN